MLPIARYATMCRSAPIQRIVFCWRIRARIESHNIRESILYEYC
jgi:hypothetical protein